VPNLYDGFWFPSSIRNRFIKPNTPYETLHFSSGTTVPVAGLDTVTVRWPRLDLADWKQVMSHLQDNRRHVQQQDWENRLPQAMQRMRDTWLNQANPLRQQVLRALASCTGHSAEMLDLALGFLELISVDDLQRAGSCRFSQAVRSEFVSVEGVPGRIRFFDDRWWSRLSAETLLRSDSCRDRAWRLRRVPADVVVGYAAGNVPGTGLLLILLGLAGAAWNGSGPPVIVVKNSSREPLFTPLVLTVLEMIDPVLLETTLVTLWDYTDRALQEYLIGQADLVVAAASDDTIDAIGQTVQRVSRPSRPIRFHRHGHKVSFSTVGRECLAVASGELLPGVRVLDAVALLAALDVALWNQQGCLSSRVHFVERGTGPDYHPVEVYGRALADSLRVLNDLIPKANPMRRQIHNLFDKYQSIAAGGQMQVFSGYDDDFLVVLDRRGLAAEQFKDAVNDCQGRAVVVVPVDDVMQIPQHYLRQLRHEHLQSMSVALGDPGVLGLDARLLHYAQALGAAGVTGIRTVGRGAFPQLALSWDGLIPLDLTASRPRGHFTAIEFDEQWAQIRHTYTSIHRAMQHAPAGSRSGARPIRGL
jgi:hypothetical protein